jgi:hypothetical protein
MNSDTLSQICTCGRTFSHLGAFKNHQNNCKRANSRLEKALAKAKQILTAKKAKIISPSAVSEAPGTVEAISQTTTAVVELDVQV